MESLTIKLMAWLAANTGYDTANMPLPEVTELSPQEITSEAYSDNPELSPVSGIDERVFALYSYEDGPFGTIYVLGADFAGDQVGFGSEQIATDEPSWMNPIFHERVLHELIHHAQRMSGATDGYPCRNFGEREAYLLGGEFLSEHQVTDPLPNRKLLSLIYSRC